MGLVVPFVSFGCSSLSIYSPDMVSPKNLHFSIITIHQLCLYSALENQTYYIRTDFCANNQKNKQYSQ